MFANCAEEVCGMLVLFETSAGYAIFKVNEAKLASNTNVEKYFGSIDQARKLVKLKTFSKFENTTQGLEELTTLGEGNISEDLKRLLKSEFKKIKDDEKLVVGDSKLAKSISKKFKIQVVSDDLAMEMMRGIRSQLSGLLTDVDDQDMNRMQLGLSHSLCRFKVKFSPERVDTMIIQAVVLLDDLDKELNTYSMRLKEWYGWHFPELSKIVVDNVGYAKTILKLGFRTNAAATDFGDIVAEDVEREIKRMAEMSVGTEINETDLENINSLADQIVLLNGYREELNEYLRNRMIALAPNLTSLVGELVGARLISHAGSLMNLAKQPASTVQILGAEKALFRALKTKQNTPKYGLIFHASLVGQAETRLKGKMARILAAKSALSARIDALSDPDDRKCRDVGNADRLRLEQRLRQLEKEASNEKLGTRKSQGMKKCEFVVSRNYNPSGDMTMPHSKKFRKS